MAAIRTKSELEPRLGEEEVLSLTSSAAWELLNTRASTEVELKEPKQVPSEAARHTLHTELQQQVLLYQPQSCLDKESTFKDSSIFTQKPGIRKTKIREADKKNNL